MLYHYEHLKHFRFGFFSSSSTLTAYFSLITNYYFIFYNYVISYMVQLAITVSGYCNKVFSAVGGRTEEEENVSGLMNSRNFWFMVPISSYYILIIKFIIKIFIWIELKNSHYLRHYPLP